MLSTEFKDWMQTSLSEVEQALAQYLPAENHVPTRLHAAMRYTTLGGGKRVRPLLVQAAALLGPSHPNAVLAAACATECIHAYSLVHDDMPCMDDDVLRRGQPTVHVAYDEATALLVGDALQTLAFTILSRPLPLPAERQLQMLALLADASGSHGMAGGQAIDLASTGLSLTLPELEQLHIMKTGALIRASVLLGGHAAQLDTATMEALDHFAKAIGLAFQVVDDILDTEEDSSTLGKTAGKDAEQNKATYVTLLGLVEAKHWAHELHQKALAAIQDLGPASLRLQQLAELIVKRRQ